MTAPSPGTEVYEHPDEARMAAFRRVYDEYRIVEDIYPGLAQRLREAGVTRFAELGGGRGPISALLSASGVCTCVIDLDPQMLAEAHRPALAHEGGSGRSAAHDHEDRRAGVGPPLT